MDEFSFTEMKNTMKGTELKTYSRQLESSSGGKEVPGHKAKQKGQGGWGTVSWEVVV